MSNDSLLFTECLDTFKKLKNWVDPDYYKVHVMPTVQRLRDRLAVIETDMYLSQKKSEPERLDFGPSTVPDSLGKDTGFGLFDDIDDLK